MTSGDTRTKDDSQASFHLDPLIVSDISVSRFSPRPNHGDTFTDCLRRAVTESDPLVFVTPFFDDDELWRKCFDFWVKKLLDKYLIRKYQLKVTDNVARLKINQSHTHLDRVITKFMSSWRSSRVAFTFTSGPSEEKMTEKYNLVTSEENGKRVKTLYLLQ